MVERNSDLRGTNATFSISRASWLSGSSTQARGPLIAIACGSATPGASEGRHWRDRRSNRRSGSVIIPSVPAPSPHRPWCRGVPHGASHARGRHPRRTWRFTRRRSKARADSRASLTAIGLSLGLALSFRLAHFIAAWLYGVGANDPLTVIVVVVLLGAMSVLACYFPARRASIPLLQYARSKRRRIRAEVARW